MTFAMTQNLNSAYVVPTRQSLVIMIRRYTLALFFIFFLFTGCDQGNVSNKKVENYKKTDNHKTIALIHPDTSIYTTDTCFVAWPQLLLINDSVSVYYDRISQLLLTYSKNGNKLINIDNIYNYIDKNKFPLSMYEIFALNIDSIYCFLYNNFFLVNKSSRIAEKIDLNMNFDEIDYLPEAIFQSSVINREYRYAVVAVVPSMSPLDKQYLDKKGFLFIDLKNYQTRLLPIQTPKLYIRGKHYNLTSRPKIALKDETLFILHPIYKFLQIYNIHSGTFNEIELNFAHFDISTDFIPYNSEKARTGFYWYANNVMEMIYSDENLLYIIYRKGDEDWAKKRNSYKDRLFLLVYDDIKQEIIADQKFSEYSDDVYSLTVYKNKFLFRLKETESDILNEFKVIEYEVVH